MPIRDVFAFQAQSANFRLASGALTQGGGAPLGVTLKVIQGSVGEPCVAKSQSAGVRLQSGFITTLISNPPIQTQTIPNQSWLENQSKANVFDLDDYFQSPDGSVLAYTFTGNSHIAIVIDPQAHLVSFSQPQAWNGTEAVRFTARDQEGNSVQSNEAVFQIQGVDNPPVLDYIQDVIVNESDLAAVVPHASDLDGDQITYTFGAPLNSQGQWQTGYNDAGSYKATVTATDSTGLLTSRQVKIIVRNVNRPPALDVIPDMTVTEGELVKLNPMAHDPDDDSIAYYYSSPLDPSGKWLTSYNDAGTYSVTVTASDGIDTISQNVNIIVQNANRKPQVDLVLTKQTLRPNELTYISVTASDPDNGVLTFSLKKDGQEIASGPITNIYQASTAFADIGDHVISVAVIDNGGLVTEVVKGIDVANPNFDVNALSPIMGDFNGDCLTDLGFFDADAGMWKVALFQKGIYSNAVTWLTSFGSRSSIPLGGDFNGDGKMDTGIYDTSTGEVKIALSTGSGFSVSGAWLIFSGHSSAWQPFAGNFNGDKFTDIAFYNKDTGEAKVALGTGTGFGAFVAWISGFGTGYIAMAADFNGDSLADLCLFNKSTGEFKVAFSDSKAFVDGASWISGFAQNKDPFLSDFNHDGLADVGYWDNASFSWNYAVSTGRQFINKGVWKDNFGASTDESATTGDFNGDGMIDRALFDKDALGILRWKVQLNGDSPADIISEIDNGIGGKTRVDYTYASLSENDLLPFPVYVASSISLVDTLPVGSSEESYTQNFAFSGGYFDAAEREFRGFAKVVVTDPVTNNYTESYFYQGKPGQDAALKGQIQKVLAYDGNGRQISETLNTYDVRKSGPADGVVAFPSLKEQATTVWEEDGSSLATKSSFTYDNIGNVLQAMSEGDISRTGDEKSASTSYARAYFEGFNRPLEVLLKDKDGAVVSKKDFEYDLKGSLSREIVLIFNPVTQETTTASNQYSYDDYGNLTSSIDALNHTVTTEYDAILHAFPVRITNILGHVVSYVYDQKLGVVTSMTDPNGNTSTTIYDSMGRVVESKNAYNDTVVHYSYPDFNTKITTQMGLSKTEYADGLGRKYKSVSNGEDGAVARVVSSEVYYSDRGLIEKESIVHYTDEDPSQISYVSYEYDLRGRPKKTTSDFPGTAKDSFSQIDYVSPLYTESIDPEGHKKGARKDVYGNVIEVTEFTSGGVYKTGYEYDIQGNLIKVTDNAGNVTQLWYDSLGRKLKMDDPDMGVWAYEYDLLGNLTKQTDAKNQALEFTYDALNRLTKKTRDDGRGMRDEINYFYDDTLKPNCIGRLSKVMDQSGSTEFFYDKLGREIKSVKTVDAAAYTVERTYDVLDRLIKLTYPDGESVGYNYDINSGLLESVVSLRGSAATEAIFYVNSINYNASGQIKTIKYGNNTQTTYTYGQDLRLSRILTQGTAILQDLNYVFDKNGNVTTLTDNLRNNIRTFAYDDLDRLTLAQNIPAASGGHEDFNFQYDSIGNMTYKSDVGVMTYGINAGPHAVTNAGGYSYSYDHNGNMVSGKNKTLEYDSENRIIRVTQGSDVSTFAYDGDGGRVKKNSINSITQQTQSTLYIGSLFEIDSSGKTTKHIFAGANRIASVSLRGSAAAEAIYYHSDHLGSSSIITDSTGQQVAHYEYTPYGSVIASPEVAKQSMPYLFTGKELDNTGLYFYGARYYDPEIGRFITADTIVQAPYDPQTLNHYSYCNNNPLNYVDPSGHSWFKKFFGKIFGFIAGVAATIFSGGNMMAGFQAFNFVDSLFTTINTGSWGAFAGGLAGGLIGGYLGGGLANDISGMLGKQSFTFGGGFLIGAAEMGLGGFGGSFGSALGSGASFGDAMKSGAIGLGISGVTGGLIEGSYLSGMQKFAHGMDRNAVGKAAGVDRGVVLEVVKTPLPLVAEAVVSGESGMHWGLKIQDNYNEWNGTWDFDIASRNVLVRGAASFGKKVSGMAGISQVRNWSDASIVSVDTVYISKVYGNIQENIGRHFYRTGEYTCQNWVNNRRYLLNDGFAKP